MNAALVALLLLQQAAGAAPAPAQPPRAAGTSLAPRLLGEAK